MRKIERNDIKRYTSGFTEIAMLKVKREKGRNKMVDAKKDSRKKKGRYKKERKTNVDAKKK